ncbi:MAG: DUF523 and DUF1722 domain-containing protein [Calditrichia bacterium]
MTDSIKPRVGLSRCLEIAACRYNGQLIPNNFVHKLLDFVEFIPVCPEEEIGLGTPRDPIRLVMKGNQIRLVQPATGRDVTKHMLDFSGNFLNSLGAIDGFILKSRSPSCGPADVKVYPVNEKSAPLAKSRGLFGEAVLRQFGHLAVEDEGRLNNFTIREHFLTKLFILARFREMKKSGKHRNLVEFHSQNKLLYMAYNQKEARAMGQVTANADRQPFDTVTEDYSRHLCQAFSKMPRHTSNINVLMHALGYFKKELTSREKSYFLETLEKYRNRKVPLSVPVHVMNSYIVRFDAKYLARQTFFNPFPAEFVDITDSGKGRSL